MTQSIPKFTINAVNLASPRLGTKVIQASDEFFAPKERLLKDEDPIFIADKYDDHGKWMDGWESRRRRDDGHDYCIVRLGAQGTIKGVDIETTHFTGNHPPEASIDGVLSDNGISEDRKWINVVPRQRLDPDAHNFFKAESDERFNTLRLNIFPDGGVARLRVYGEPLSEWDQTNPDGEHELSSITNGAKIVGYNDAHYGSPWVILAPGRGQNMGDGWETRRRREPGNDWIVVALGAPGLVERIEIDTAYFKGNYPDRCSVQGALVANGVDILQDAETWPELMEQKKLQMDQIHTFDRSAINVSGPVSHVRLNIFPDGGVSRFRVFGKLAKE
ncbi:MAG: allantoicase [Rhodospirillaceae bacterium]|jgi:allantoicase|nr:allantoicase [Rhodospirillaceae bacterium]MBT5036143.1 allantoicase [Rhodospirillaceae bacterium]MBT6219871.1 allantoicase [Rhodospirillaceae bacterium]MBT7484793.1 allantoicase [Rhodospirillales bacterium]